MSAEVNEYGLPASGADFEFRARPRRGGDGPLVLGEDEYGAGTVALDPASGQVRLTEGSDGGGAWDLLASDLGAFVELVALVESVADRAATAEGPRGPSAVAQALVRAEERMREIDPGLFEAAGGEPPAHWCTALLLRALGLGARRGDGLAYEIGTELVQELAELSGDGTVHRYPSDGLPPGLTHEPTRRLLTEVGLPDGGDLFSACEPPLHTMAQARPDALGERPHQGPFVEIGWWPHDLPIALDGATGGLELPAWYGGGKPAAYLHQDLSALLYACWTYERLRAEWYRWEEADHPWQVFDPMALLVCRVDELVAAVDPEAFATESHSWRMLADDPYTGGLLA